MNTREAPAMLHRVTGTLVPSSNRTVERTLAAIMLAPPPDRLAELVREVAPAADAVLIWRTTLPGCRAAAAPEAELDIPVFDVASVGVWACLAAIGLNPRPAATFGRIFTLTG